MQSEPLSESELDEAERQIVEADVWEESHAAIRLTTAKQLIDLARAARWRGIETAPKISSPPPPARKERDGDKHVRSHLYADRGDRGDNHSVADSVAPPPSESEGYLSDGEFREKYAPLIEQFVRWRTRLNRALGLDPLDSMEHAVAAVERCKPPNLYTVGSPEYVEETTCTCGAGHGSLEGHVEWCAFLKPSPPSSDVAGLCERLDRYANDPMWADHAEVPKELIRKVTAALRRQTA